MWCRTEEDAGGCGGHCMRSGHAEGARVCLWTGTPTHTLHPDPIPLTAPTLLTLASRRSPTTTSASTLTLTLTLNPYCRSPTTTSASTLTWWPATA